jgi:transcriptional regulator with XRE-family HTH domain
MTEIARTLTDKNMSVADFCRAANLYETAAYPLCAGKRKAGPTVRQRVCEALGVSEDTLFGGDGWPLTAKVEARTSEQP